MEGFFSIAEEGVPMNILDHREMMPLSHAVFGMVLMLKRVNRRKQEFLLQFFNGVKLKTHIL